MIVRAAASGTAVLLSDIAVSGPPSLPAGMRIYSAPSGIPAQLGRNSVHFNLNNGCPGSLQKREHSVWVRATEIDIIKRPRVGSDKSAAAALQHDAVTAGESGPCALPSTPTGLIDQFKQKPNHRFLACEAARGGVSQDHEPGSTLGATSEDRCIS